MYTRILVSNIFDIVFSSTGNYKAPITVFTSLAPNKPSTLEQNTKSGICENIKLDRYLNMLGLHLDSRFWDSTSKAILTLYSPTCISV